VADEPGPSYVPFSSKHWKRSLRPRRGPHVEIRRIIQREEVLVVHHRPAKKARLREPKRLGHSLDLFGGRNGNVLLLIPDNHRRNVSIEGDRSTVGEKRGVRGGECRPTEGRRRLLEKLTQAPPQTRGSTLSKNPSQKRSNPPNGKEPNFLPIHARPLVSHSFESPNALDTGPPFGGIPRDRIGPA